MIKSNIYVKIFSFLRRHMVALDYVTYAHTFFPDVHTSHITHGSFMMRLSLIFFPLELRCFFFFFFSVQSFFWRDFRREDGRKSKEHEDGGLAANWYFSLCSYISFSLVLAFFFFFPSSSLKSDGKKIRLIGRVYKLF